MLVATATVERAARPFMRGDGNARAARSTSVDAFQLFNLSTFQPNEVRGACPHVAQGVSPNAKGLSPVRNVGKNGVGASVLWSLKFGVDFGWGFGRICASLDGKSRVRRNGRGQDIVRELIGSGKTVGIGRSKWQKN